MNANDRARVDQARGIYDDSGLTLDQADTYDAAWMQAESESRA